MCDKVILEVGGMLESVRAQYNTQEMCSKGGDNHVHALTFVPKCYKIQEMCDNTVDNYPSTIQYIPDQCKTQNMSDKVVNGCYFISFCSRLIYEKKDSRNA